MRVTPTRRRRRGNGAVESWASEGDDAPQPSEDTDVPTVVLPAHVAAATADVRVTASPEKDRPASATLCPPLGEMQSVETITAATELLQRIDRLQAELERAAQLGAGEDIHVAHDYRAACVDLIKQFPWLALSKDVDQRLWASWQRELAVLESQLATAAAGEVQMKLRDALYVALRNYSALIQDVQATARSTAASASTGTTDKTTPLLLHRLSLAHAHVMYALEIHSAGQDGKKNWRTPALYYERARRWCVAQGETHYHLARIVLHDNRCAEALYHLVRSRIASSPFDSPGSLVDQFAHVLGLRESTSSDGTTSSEAASWLQLDRTVLSVVAPYFGQQQEFMAHRRAPLELAAAFCHVLDSICGDSPSDVSVDERDATIASVSIQLVRIECLLIACACVQSDLVQSSVATPPAVINLVSVKNPRAIELLVSIINGLLHRVLSAITSPLRVMREKEQALQLMLPSINVAFAWLVRIQWRDMVVEATRASCEQLSTMVLTAIIAGGFLAPHEEIASTTAQGAVASLVEEAEVIGFVCYESITSDASTGTVSAVDLAATQDDATERELLQRRIVKFLSFVEAFMTPRPAAAAVIASAVPAASVHERASEDVARQMDQLSVATSSSASTATPATGRVVSADMQRDAAPSNGASVRELWTPATMTTSTRSTSKSKAKNSAKAPPATSATSTIASVGTAAPAAASIASSERVVVLDAANIAMRHGLQRRFSCRGIQLCAEYFIAQGDRVVAFLPDYCLDVDADGSYRRRVAVSGGGGRGRRREGRSTITPDDRVLLEILVDSGVVVLTPAMDSDDLYCIHYAKRHNAFLVTNDLFRDHISETDGPKARQTELRNWLQSRRISYTWVADEFLPNPNSDYEKARSLTAAVAPAPPTQTAAASATSATSAS